jgi:hypothetical protein
VRSPFLSGLRLRVGDALRLVRSMPHHPVRTNMAPTDSCLRDTPVELQGEYGFVCEVADCAEHRLAFLSAEALLAHRLNRPLGHLICETHTARLFTTQEQLDAHRAYKHSLECHSATALPRASSAAASTSIFDAYVRARQPVAGETDMSPGPQGHPHPP